jgi:hypothetical protein
MITTLNEYNQQTAPPKKLLILESYASAKVTETLYAKQFIKPIHTLIYSPLQTAHRVFSSAADLQGYVQFPDAQIWQDPNFYSPDVIYITGHGIPAGLRLSLGSITKDELISCFNGLNYYSNIVYFSACEVFAGEEGNAFAKEFIDKTGTMAVIGYSRAVPLIDSLLIDIMFLTRFFESEGRRFDKLHAIYESVLRDYPMAKEYGYKLFLKDN